MHSSLAYLALVALTSTVSAGTYYIDNHCNFDMYLKSTSTPETTNPLIHLPPNTTNAYSELMRDAGYSLNAMTLSRTPDLASPIQATYHETTTGPTPGLNFYALSTIYGDPLREQGFVLTAYTDGFSINCEPRTVDGGDCPNTYSPSNPNGVNAVFCENDLEDLVLSLCKHNP